MTTDARRLLVAIVLAALVSMTFATAVFSSTIVSATFEGGAGTAVVSGTLFSRTGASLTLAVRTDGATQCVALTGAHTASSTTPVVIGPADKTWTFAMSAVNGGDGVRTATVSAFDDPACAGAASTTLASYTVDNTAPTVSASIPQVPSSAGWYNADVSITWSAVDAGSGVATGPTPATDSQVTDTTSVIKQSTATDRVGNSRTGQVIIKVDKTLPTITGSRTHSANSNGWNNTDVTVSFTCSDGRSGIRTCAGATMLTSNGAGQTVTGSALDFAGNTNSAAVTVNIDKAAPTVSGAPALSPNAAGWYNADVAVDWTCVDSGGSGFAPGECDDSMITAEGVDLSLTKTVSDLAGNSSVTATSLPAVNLDKTAPSILATASPGANENGWNNGPVAVTFECADGLSGVASCESVVTLSADGAGQSATGHAADNAGNASSATLAGVNIDMTSPVVRVIGVSDGGTHTEGSYSASCDTADALSGVASAASLSAQTGPTGVVTLTCAGASDHAGNTAAPASVSITVVASGPTFAFSGFKRPLVANALNAARAGSSVPVKFSLGGYRGMDIFAAGSPASAASRCGGAPPAGAYDRAARSNAKTLTYDASTDTYSLIWKTDKSWTGCRVFVLTFVDGSSHWAVFRFR